MKKIFKRTSLLLATALIGGTATVQAQKSPQDMDRFIDALMRRMTVEEKIVHVFVQKTLLLLPILVFAFHDDTIF